MSERLPLSPFQYESELSDSEELNPYNQLTIFECSQSDMPNCMDVHTGTHVWDMTDEVDDDFPNDSSMITNSTLTSQTSVINSNNGLHHSIFSEEEYSQELNGSTLFRGCPIPFKTTSLNSNNDSYKPATSSNNGSSEISIKKTIYQTMCPHLISFEDHHIIQSEEVSYSNENEVSIINTTSNPIVFDEDTEDSTDEERDQFYSYCSTTSDDLSDLDYSEPKKKKKNAKVKETTPSTKVKDSKRKRKKKSKSSSSPHANTTTIPVAEGDIAPVYPEGFLRISLEMPASSKGLQGLVPACKPLYFKEGDNLVKDETPLAKFFVNVEAVNCPNTFDLESINMVLLSCSTKDRIGEVINIERFFDNDGFLDTSNSSHSTLKLDPSGKDLLIVNKSEFSDSSTAQFECCVTTSNNHGNWATKHGYYRLLVSSSDASVMAGVSVPFKVAKNASKGRNPVKSTNAMKKKQSPISIHLNMPGRKKVRVLTENEPSQIITYHGTKFQVTLTRMEEND